MIWIKYVFLCRSSFKNSQKRQKTISIPHWYRYGLSKNEQSKFGLIPGKIGGHELASKAVLDQHTTPNFSFSTWNITSFQHVPNCVKESILLSGWLLVLSGWCCCYVLCSYMHVLCSDIYAMFQFVGFNSIRCSFKNKKVNPPLPSTFQKFRVLIALYKN